MSTLTPAYGRDYKSEAEVIADYEAGKDFIFNGIGPYCGKYCSIRDFPSEQVKLRYNKKTEAVLYKGDNS